MKRYTLSRKEVIRQSKEGGDSEVYLNYSNITPLLNIFPTKNNEFVIWTNEGYFTVSSEKAMKYVYYHINQGFDKEARVVPLEKLYDVFFRPDLIQLKLLGGEKEYREITQKINYAEALKVPAPTISIDKVDNKKNMGKGISTQHKKIKIAFSIHENIDEKTKIHGGLGLIRIYHEGKLIETRGSGKINRQSANADTQYLNTIKNTKNMKSQKKGKGGENLSKLEEEGIKTTNITNNILGLQKPLEIELKSGDNEISIEAFNKTNTIASYRTSVIVNAEIKKEEAKLHAIILGVNKFEDNFPLLEYSLNDAKAIHNIVKFKMKKVFSGQPNITYLTNEDVTLSNIIKSIKKIKANLNDTILFYISTHGFLGKKDGIFYLIPSDSADDKNWISFNNIFENIQNIKALNQIFIVDACESGGANSYVSAMYDSRALVLARSSGVHMLMATTKDANAYESKNKKVKYGVFTSEILKTLKNKNIDKNKDGKISIKEVSQQLNNLQENKDRPLPVIYNIGNDINLIEEER